jgi:arabinose-5-phosphate isomerase
MNGYARYAAEVIEAEIAGLKALQLGLGQSFEDALEVCGFTLAEGGKLVLTGIGKSAHISRKIAATLMSTGSPAAFLYPVEAMHGDMGMLAKNDLIIAVSYSGETNELLNALPSMKRLGHKILAITKSTESRLGKMADYVLTMDIGREACPFGLAPTTSTTALLALGDALALCLMKRHEFTKEDYGRLHPSGAIGRSLTLRAEDVMHSVDDAIVSGRYVNGVKVDKKMMAVDVLKLMKEKGVSYAVVVGEDFRVGGLIFLDDLKSLKA